jgi:putative SOS response-associated peptidase YedK
MCGRYRLSRRKQILAEQFDASPFDNVWEPRYNIAPSQTVPVIRQRLNFRELSPSVDETGSDLLAELGIYLPQARGGLMQKQIS